MEKKLKVGDIMSENRVHELRSLSQTTGEYNDDLVVLDDFGALMADAELLEESPVAVEELVDLQVGNTLRFGGGAAPLLELKRIS